MHRNLKNSRTARPQCVWAPPCACITIRIHCTLDVISTSIWWKYESFHFTPPAWERKRIREGEWVKRELCSVRRVLLVKAFFKLTMRLVYIIPKKETRRINEWMNETKMAKARDIIVNNSFLWYGTMDALTLFLLLLVHSKLWKLDFERFRFLDFCIFNSAAGAAVLVLRHFGTLANDFAFQCLPNEEPLLFAQLSLNLI